MTAILKPPPIGTARYSGESAATRMDVVRAVGAVPTSTEHVTSDSILIMAVCAPKAEDDALDAPTATVCSTRAGIVATGAMKFC